VGVVCRNTSYNAPYTPVGCHALVLEVDPLLKGVSRVGIPVRERLRRGQDPPEDSRRERELRVAIVSDTFVR